MNQNHEMRLDKKYFDQIKNGEKTIEYRLNDEKRQKIKIGDTITFYKKPLEDETITVKVLDLKRYDTLLEMFQDTFNIYLKNFYETPLEVVKEVTYYTDEEIQKYGCLAIFIQK